MLVIVCTTTAICNCRPLAEIQREAARTSQLFAVMRSFDEQGAKLIWVEPPPSGCEWDDVRDQLGRAAA